MNRKFAFLTALVAGLLPVASFAQASPTPPAPAAAPQPGPPPAPTAFPAKIALINFEQAVIATNEGQQAMVTLQKKYEPKIKQFQDTEAEIENLKKQAESGRATMSPDEYASRVKTIDNKEKALERDSDDFKTQAQQDQQDAYAKVAAKFDVVMRKFCADNGYTLLLNAGTQEPFVMWITDNPNSDISYAVIQVYNAQSGVAAPPPAAPSAQRAPAKPAGSSTTTPRPSTAPKPAAPPTK
jgi:Skp family chaperone for outer membrane proteins